MIFFQNLQVPVVMAANTLFIIPLKFYDPKFIFLSITQKFGME
jgi:hypothetical protein